MKKTLNKLLILAALSVSILSGCTGGAKETGESSAPATDYEVSAAGRIYTFTIRDDVKFSDGQPLKPEDVIFTYNTAKNSGSSVDLTMLEKAEVIDGNKVQFTMNGRLQNRGELQ